MTTKQKKIDFTRLLKGYKSGWIAVSSTFDSVVVWGKTLKEVMRKAKKTQKHVFYFPVEKCYSNFIGMLNDYC